ncbi:hypothetical protein [Hydrogenophaga sp.]|nr:hypothetical protein [Hydrogenophaga sp.]MDO9133615.1 hypothetical protein [Hydrogenophaga sp.]
MQRSIMDMALMISAAIRHAADHNGKTEVVTGNRTRRHSGRTEQTLSNAR